MLGTKEVPSRGSNQGGVPEWVLKWAGFAGVVTSQENMPGSK